MKKYNAYWNFDAYDEMPENFNNQIRIDINAVNFSALRKQIKYFNNVFNFKTFNVSLWYHYKINKNGKLVGECERFHIHFLKENTLTIEKGFKYIENESFESSFKGLFSEINLNSEKLGKSYTERNALLCKVIKTIANKYTTIVAITKNISFILSSWNNTPLYKYTIVL